jgi:hypothetical protein
MLPPHAQMWSLAVSHYLPRCLHVIAELGVADAIDTHPVTTADIALKSGAHADTLNRMLTLVATAGVFRAADGGWAHTPLSDLLRSDHPQSLRAFVRMSGSDPLWSAAGALTASVRSGDSGIQEATGRSIWDHFADNPEAHRIFDAAMTGKAHADIAALWDVLDLSPYQTVADIAGGRGHILAALLDRAPATRGILFDLPTVAASMPPNPRIEARGGSFFTDPLPQADAYILSNILHDWDDQACLAILAAIRKAAQSGGVLFILEDLLSEADGPHPSKVLDVVMLAATGGRERTEPQYAALLHSTGFELARILPTPSPLSVLVARAV